MPVSIGLSACEVFVCKYCVVCIQFCALNASKKSRQSYSLEAVSKNDRIYHILILQEEGTRIVHCHEKTGTLDGKCDNRVDVKCFEFFRMS